MIQLTQDLPALIVTYFLPFVRVSAIVMTLPIIGTQLVPAKVKIMLSLGLTFIVASMSDLQSSHAIDFSLISAFLSIIYQIVIGVLFGLIIHVIFQAFNLAGQIIAMQMGLGFAQLVDPQNGISVPAVSQFYMLMATLLYLSMNGHLYVINAIIESFHTLPAAIDVYKPIPFEDIFHLGSVMFFYGLKIALPAVIALLITNIAFGVMTKVAPQLNLFTIGFSISMVIGIALIWINLAFVLPQFNELTEDTHTTLAALFQ